MTDKLLYSREEASQLLSLSVSSIDQLIRSAQMRVRRTGRRVLIPKNEIEKIARRDTQRIWPPKRAGKTTRRFAAQDSEHSVAKAVQNPDQSLAHASQKSNGPNVPTVMGDMGRPS